LSLFFCVVNMQKSFIIRKFDLLLHKIIFETQNNFL